MHGLKRLLVVNLNSKEADELSLLLRLSQPPMLVLTVYNQADALALSRKGHFEMVVVCLASNDLVDITFARTLRRLQIKKSLSLMVFSRQQGRLTG